MLLRPFNPSPTHFRTAFAVLAIIAGVCGCASDKAAAVASDNVTGIASSAARIDVRADTITSTAKTLPTSPQRITIVEQAGGIKVDGHDIAAQLAAEQENIRLMAGTINNQTIENRVQAAELHRLNTVWIAPRMWHAVTWAIVGFFSLGIASIVLGAVSPLGWGMTISRLINTIMPLSTGFVWIRDLLIAQLRGRVATYVPASAVPPSP